MTGQIKRVCVLSLLSFLALGGAMAGAEEVFTPPFDGHVTRVIGTIQDKGLNTITVYDETDKVSRTLVYVLDSGWLHVGDRVVVYYQRRGNTVERIKKMRSPKYRESGQNLGYMKKGQK